MEPLVEKDLNLCISKLPKKVKEILMEYPAQAVVAGGYIRDTITKSPISDIDIFFTKDGLSEKILTEKYNDTLFDTHNATSIKDKEYVVQLIKEIKGIYPLNIIANFDFYICGAAIWYEKNKWQSGCLSEFYDNIGYKILIYNKFPTDTKECLISLCRIMKLRSKGYVINLADLSRLLAILCSTFQKYTSDLSSANFLSTKFYNILLNHAGYVNEMENINVLDKMENVPSPKNNFNLLDI